MARYNGWANYATWRTNLELFDGMTPQDLGVYPSPETAEDDINALANSLEGYAYEIVEEEAKGWARDIAKSFLQDVEWIEIAEHLVYDAIAEAV